MSDMKRYPAGRGTASSRSYRGWVKSPLVELCMAAVGIPPNMEPVQRAGSSGCALSQTTFSRDIPTQPEMSDWFTIFPPRTSGAKAYESSRKPRSIPSTRSIFFFITVYLTNCSTHSASTLASPCRLSCKSGLRPIMARQSSYTLNPTASICIWPASG